MESKESQNSGKQESLAELPSFFQYISSKAVAGFDNVEDNGDVEYQFQTTVTPATNPSSDPPLAKGPEAASIQSQPSLLPSHMPTSSVQAIDLHPFHSISISMPTSPSGFHLEQAKRVIFTDNTGENVSNSGVSNVPAKSTIANTQQPRQAKFYSLPIPSGITHAEAITAGKLPNPSERHERNLRNDRFKDKRFDSFKTWSGKLERQISNLRGKQQEEHPEINDMQNVEVEILPVDRFFDALEGPELDTLKASEELVLPEDKQWPFLLRYPISSFGICLGVSSQAILWKALATSPSTRFLHVSLIINLILWCISIALTAVVSFTYSLKFIFNFEAVRREFHHPIRVNFFFAPWITFLFLVIGVPPVISKNLHAVLWYLLMAPILCLELKIYGQWMSGGQRRLSKVANPSNHLSIVGNFVGALLGASMGLKEGPIFFFAIGLAHYMVLFVTLYQRLPTNETLPKELHPVFFLFVAAPSVASMAWANIQGGFDMGSKIAYFIALFLYISLAVRVNFFRGFRFSWAWWAYTFPMTGASIATIKYSNEVKNPLTQFLSVLLSAISTLTVTALFVSTVFHALVLRNLFPNDIAIAIAKGRPKMSKKNLNLRSASSDTKVIKASLTISKDV